MVDGIRPRLNVDKPGGAAPSQSQNGSKQNAQSAGAAQAAAPASKSSGSGATPTKNAGVASGASASQGKSGQSRGGKALKAPSIFRKKAPEKKIAVPSSVPQPSPSQIASLSDPGSFASMQGQPKLSPKMQATSKLTSAGARGLSVPRGTASQPRPSVGSAPLAQPSPASSAPAATQGSTSSVPAAPSGAASGRPGTNGMQGAPSAAGSQKPVLSDAQKAVNANRLNQARDADKKEQGDSGSDVSKPTLSTNPGQQLGNQVGGVTGQIVKKATMTPTRLGIAASVFGFCFTNCVIILAIIALIIIVILVVYGGIESIPGGEYLLKFGLWVAGIF